MKRSLVATLTVALVTFGLCFFIACNPAVFLKGNFYYAVETYACPILDIMIIVSIISVAIAIKARS
ncbi:MAG: hypothetical protein WC364_13745 [Eubacteriales bacterium]|jgi:hypothetical protein